MNIKNGLKTTAKAKDIKENENQTYWKGCNVLIYCQEKRIHYDVAS